MRSVPIEPAPWLLNPSILSLKTASHIVSPTGRVWRSYRTAMVGSCESVLISMITKGTALAKVNQELESQAAYVEGRAFIERRTSETEIKQTDRDHRLEQANAFQNQAESIRRNIRENTRSHEQLVKRREEIEERMRVV